MAPPVAAPAPPPLPPPPSPCPQSVPCLDSVPDDVAVAVAGLLGLRDLCALGSCSRFWRRLCSSDCLWAALFAQRWPSMETSPSLTLISRPWPSPDVPFQRPVVEEGEGSSSESASANLHPSSALRPTAKEWKSFYVSYHQEMSQKISNVIKVVKQCTQSDSLEVGDYLKALAALQTLNLGFDDIKFFLLTSKYNVLLNLIGLHYMIFYLRLPDTEVIAALRRSNISERQVCVKWFKLGRWFYGFRLPDESLSRSISLMEFATSDAEVRNILNRGAIHEVLRVQIISVFPGTS